MPRLAILLAILVALIVASQAGAEENIFAPFLNDEPPEIVEIMEKTTKDGVEITRLRFLNRTIPESGEKVVCYGILHRPVEAKGPRPGVLVCHGGGASADKVAGFSMGWAKRGYVSFCQDEPGIGPENVQPHTSGPWTKNNWGRFTVEPDPRCSILFDGVASALNGLRFLRSQPDVDKSKIGVTGGSWGGYMTTMVAGLAGDRVTAAFCVYGCGFYELGSAWRNGLIGFSEQHRETWLEHLDSGRRAHNMKAAYFTTPATNDWFFWPPAVMATWNEISSPKNIAWSPNDSHVITFPGGARGPQKIETWVNRTYMEIPFMAYHLEGKGQAFNKCAPDPDATRDGAEVRVRFRVEGPRAVKTARVYHSYGEQPWRMRWWEDVEAKALGGGLYEANVPVYEPTQPVSWFGYTVDEKDITICTVMNGFDPLKVGFGESDRTDRQFAEDFEGDIDKRWVVPYPARRSFAKRKAKFRLSAEAAHRGKRGLMLENDIEAMGNGFRPPAVKNGDARGIAFYVRSPGKTGYRVILRGEETGGQRREWQVRLPDPGPEWKRVEVRWSDFQPYGKGEIPFEMLSPNTAQIGFRAAPEAVVHIDDIETVK